MNNIKNNEKGFGAVEAIMAIVIVVLIGAVGWLVYKNHHKTTATPAATKISKPATPTKTTAVAPASPYSGWNSYTLKYEKISFKYPKAWTITDNSTASQGDNVILASGSNFRLLINAGSYIAPDTSANYKINTQTTTFIGQAAQLVFWSAPGQQNSNVALITLETSSGGTFKSKNVAGNVVVDMDFGLTPGAPNTEPLQTVLSDTNYKNAVLVIGSMSY